jgi:hypothetical protein
VNPGHASTLTLQPPARTQCQARLRCKAPSVKGGPLGWPVDGEGEIVGRVGCNGSSGGDLKAEGQLMVRRRVSSSRTGPGTGMGWPWQGLPAWDWCAHGREATKAGCMCAGAGRAWGAHLSIGNQLGNASALPGNKSGERTRARALIRRRGDVRSCDSGAHMRKQLQGNASLRLGIGVISVPRQAACAAIRWAHSMRARACERDSGGRVRRLACAWWARAQHVLESARYLPGISPAQLTTLSVSSFETLVEIERPLDNGSRRNRRPLWAIR